MQQIHAGDGSVALVSIASLGETGGDVLSPASYDPPIIRANQYKRLGGSRLAGL